MATRIGLGVLLIAAGLVAAVLIAVPPILEIGDRIESFPKTRISEGAVQLEARQYDVYVDVPGGTDEYSWTLGVRGPTGREVEVRPASGSVEYSWGGREGFRVGKVRIAEPGRHLVRGSGPPGARVVFATDVIRGVGRGLLLGAIAFLVLGAAGVIVIVVALARGRSREPKQWP